MCLQALSLVLLLMHALLQDLKIPVQASIATFTR